MRNHTAYVICFVQELIRLSNTGCQVVSVREPGGADPGQPRGHGPFPAGQPGMGGRGRGPREARSGGLLARRTLRAGSARSRAKCMGSLDMKSVAGAQPVPPSASGPLASVKGPVQLTVSSREIHGIAGPALPPQRVSGSRSNFRPE